MVSHALSDFKYQSAKPLNVHFVSTMDGSQLSELLHQLRPETTLLLFLPSHLERLIPYPMLKQCVYGWKNL